MKSDSTRMGKASTCFHCNKHHFHGEFDETRLGQTGSLLLGAKEAFSWEDFEIFDPLGSFSSPWAHPMEAGNSRISPPEKVDWETQSGRLLK